MNIRDAIFAILDTQEDKTLVGRTLFQKKLYFLAELTNEDFGFVPHFYGPYSSKAADHIGALCAAGFIRQDVEPTGNISGPFGETIRYVYSLTDAGKRIVASRPQDFSRYRSVSERINDHELGDNTILLPIAAKVHFIVSEKGGASEPRIRDRAQSLGWDINRIDEDAIARVVSYLKHLELVDVS